MVDAVHQHGGKWHSGSEKAYRETLLKDAVHISRRRVLGTVRLQQTDFCTRRERLFIQDTFFAVYGVCCTESEGFCFISRYQCALKHSFFFFPPRRTYFSLPSLDRGLERAHHVLPAARATHICAAGCRQYLHCYYQSPTFRKLKWGVDDSKEESRAACVHG
ncbi:unnamed protein product [Ixodes pacificus]